VYLELRAFRVVEGAHDIHIETRSPLIVSGRRDQDHASITKHDFDLPSVVTEDGFQDLAPPKLLQPLGDPAQISKRS
jgi:hypothetical protein